MLYIFDGADHTKCTRNFDDDFPCGCPNPDEVKLPDADGVFRDSIFECLTRDEVEENILFFAKTLINLPPQQEEHAKCTCEYESPDQSCWKDDPNCERCKINTVYDKLLERGYSPHRLEGYGLKQYISFCLILWTHVMKNMSSDLVTVDYNYDYE